MTPAPEREEALFQAAVQLPGSERAAFLERECHGNAALRERLETLLAAHDLPDSFMTVPTQEVPPAPDKPRPQAADEAIGLTIGRYKLLEQLGEGGCGVVYVAEQTEPIRRRVALKVIKLGMDTRQVVARFEAERQALAMMDHPNIAKILDAGVISSNRERAEADHSSPPTSDLRPLSSGSGRPYFVMELVRGIRITDYCDQHQLSTRERLDLFIQVCQAIQHAHQKGIIHRDIKPSNILVTLHDGVPVPKVIDFGIAKATEGRLAEATVYTQLHQFIGTPAYMSPEQAEMSGLDIDTRSDIYSLGVLLYELLTGKTPFDGKELIAAGLDGMRRTIREKEPVRPSTKLATLPGEELTTTAKRRGAEPPKLVHLLRGDLDWIVMKCLEKDRSRRYETANGLAVDLKRHLHHEPVIARPPTAGYRFQKAWRRNKLVYTAGLIVTAALALGFSLSAWQAAVAIRARNKAVRAEIAKDQEARIAREEHQKAETARERAERNEQQARRSLYTAAAYAAQGLIAEGNIAAAEKLLAAQIPKPGADDLRGWEWRYLSSLLRGDYVRRIGQHEDKVRALAVSPDNQSLLAGDSSGCVVLWDLETHPSKPRHRLSISGEIHRVGFSASGRIIAAVGHGMKLWDLHSSADPSMRTDEQVADFAFAPQTEQIAVLHTDGMVELRDLLTGEFRFMERTDSDVFELVRPSMLAGRHVALSPDGTRIATTETGRGIRVWNVSGGPPISFVEPDEKQREKGFMGLSFLRDNDSLVTSSFTDGPEFWQIEAERIRHVEAVGGRNLGHVTVAPDRNLIAFSGFDHTLRIYDGPNRRERVRLRGHRSEVWSVAFASNGTIFSGGQDCQILQWYPDEHQQLVSVKVEAATHLVAFSPDSQMIAIAQRSGRPLLLHLHSLSRRELPIPAHPLVFSPNGESLYLAELSRTGGTPGHEKWMPTGRVMRANLQRDDPTAEAVGSVIPDARHVAGVNSQLVAFYAANPPRLVVRNLISAEQLGQFPLTGTALTCAEFAPDGSSIVFSTADAWDVKEAFHWRLRPLEEKTPLVGHAKTVSQTAFAPDAARFATASLDETIRLWRTDTWTLEDNGILTGHTRGVSDVTFSPDGKTLASCSDGGTVKLWNVETKGLLMSLSVGRFPTSVAFSPDGRTLIVLNGRFFKEIDEILTFTAPSLSQIKQSASEAAWLGGK